MIPLLTAQRKSESITEDSLSRSDKRFLKKMEKRIDDAILRACDAMKKETSLEIKLVRYKSESNEAELCYQTQLMDILLSKYTVQGYHCQAKADMRTHFLPMSIFHNYELEVVIDIDIKWDKDYNPIG